MTWNRFEVDLVDARTCTGNTVVFWLGEPVLYHPPHMEAPVLTHISHIGDEYFLVGYATNNCLIPFTLAQRILLFKLKLTDIERELQGYALDAGERIIWQRWLDDENQRAQRKSRVRAACCGRYMFRYMVDEDENGCFRCARCAELPDTMSTSINSLSSVREREGRDGVWVKQARCEGAERIQGYENSSVYPWRNNRKNDMVPLLTHRTSSKGVIEQCTADGSCYLASFEGTQEKVLVYQSDMLGVPTAAGQIVEARTVLYIIRMFSNIKTRSV